MVRLTITENPLINLKRADFEFTDDMLVLTDEDREELAQWIKFAILSYFGAKKYKQMEEAFSEGRVNH